MNKSQISDQFSSIQEDVFLIINKHVIHLSKPVITLGYQMWNDIVFQ